MTETLKNTHKEKNHACCGGASTKEHAVEKAADKSKTANQDQTDTKPASSNCCCS